MNRAELEKRIASLDRSIISLKADGIDVSSLLSQRIDADNALHSQDRSDAANAIDPELTKGMIWVSVYGNDGKLSQPVMTAVARHGLQLRIRPTDGKSFDLISSDYTPRKPGSGKAGKPFRVLDCGKLPEEFAAKVDLTRVYKNYPDMAECIGMVPEEHSDSKYNDAYQVLSRKFHVKVELVA